VQRAGDDRQRRKHDHQQYSEQLSAASIAYRQVHEAGCKRRNTEKGDEEQRARRERDQARPISATCREPNRQSDDDRYGKDDPGIGERA
jgi:hypothetical protein